MKNFNILFFSLHLNVFLSGLKMSMAESNVSESSVDPLIQSQTSQADVQHSHILPGAEGGPSDNAENLEEYETQLFGFTPKSFVSGSEY